MSKKYPFKIANDQFGTIYCRDAESLAEALRSIKRLLLERITPAGNSVELRKEEWQALDKEIIAKVDPSRLRPFVENEAGGDNATGTVAAAVGAREDQYRQLIEALTAKGTIKMINYLQTCGRNYRSFDQLRNDIFMNSPMLASSHLQKLMVKLGLTIKPYDVFKIDVNSIGNGGPLRIRLNEGFRVFMSKYYPDGIE